ncbi:MAG: phage portal protein [Oscillospiraceae bacterium]|nr:phage portal protein [Oscillospiraceae bacterium]MBR6595174.1 phage portal protein [Oscillospiraceae bacterium]
MAEYKGISYLRRRLDQKRHRVLTRYRYYDMKNGIRYLRTLIPPEFMWMAQTLGWCAKAVDSLGDRLSFREFKNDNFDINEIFAMNNGDILPDSAINAALIGSCSFVYISPDVDGYPRMQVLDGSNATGIADPVTGMLKEGYAVIKRTDNGNPEMEAYFLPNRTEYHQGGRLIRVDEHFSPYPLLVPIIFRPDATRPFGHSRISRTCMSLQQGALRTLLRSEVSAEFYSFPQKYATGLSPEGEEMDKARAMLSSFLTFEKDEEGDSPKLGQFTQQSMSPYTEQLRTFAALFAGETGLTLDDLGFVTDNPSSAEAIKASHENLRLTARKAQKTFGSGFLNAGYLAACVRDNFAYERRQFYLTKAAWEPVFEPDAAMLSGIGDGAVKINQAVPGYFGPENLRDLTGIEPET